MNLTELEREIKSLSSGQRARLVELLLESLREAPLLEIEDKWEREIKARVSAYDRGEVETHAAEDVFAEARHSGL